MKRLSWVLLACTCLTAVADDREDRSHEQLAAWQPLVGAWRGVGQPQRGSTKDSWIAEATWSWSFAEPGPALVAEVTKDKYFRALRLLPAAGDRSYTLLATPRNGGPPIRYAGQLDDQGQLVLSAQTAADGDPTRLSFRFAAANDRLLLLMEKPGPSAGSWMRVAEVGYTRQGSGFGKIASGQECIVTGGLGTIEVTHAGKTYYVCCTGCRDYFNDNPHKVLAEHAARQASK